MINLKIKIKESTRENTLALILAGCSIVSFYFLLKNIEPIRLFLDQLIAVATPFILGFFFAFLLNSIQRPIEERLLKKWKVHSGLKRKVSVVLSLLIFLICLFVFVYLLVNQVATSVQTLSGGLSVSLESTEKLFVDLIGQVDLSQELFEWILAIVEFVILTATEYLRIHLPSILSYSMYVVTQVANFFIGLVIAVYILLDRERFYQGTQRILYAFLSKEKVTGLIRFSRLCSQMLNSFIIGKMIDSAIVGVICYIGMTILGLEFAILISFIVSVTNMIPIFGPFIGAIPSGVILLITDPRQSLVFLIWIIVLQQFDGNIMGPKILGDSMGLSTLWIMFAIIVGGAFFGVVGMFLGVPVFAVFYTLFKEIVDYRLKQRGIEVKQE